MGNLYAGAGLNTGIPLRTLELPWKDDRQDISCVPVGTYKCSMSWSHHFARPMPHLLGVPARSNIMIHDGNTLLDTEGCVVLGMNESHPGILIASRYALELFVRWLNLALLEGDVFCDISYAPAPEPDPVPRNFQVT